MAYTIYKSNGTLITVADNTIDAQFYSPNVNGAGKGVGTQLVGRNAIDYGAPIAQNFLQITENFANITPPPLPLIGQTWFDTSAGLLKVCVNDTVPTWSSLSFSAGATVTTFSGGTTGLLPSTATSGAITLSGTLGVPSGGTGATTLTGYVKGTGTSALTASATIPATDVTGLAGAVYPSQTGNSGKFLSTDGSTVSWQTVSSGGGGTVTSVDVSGGTTGLTFTGGPVSISGTITMGGVLGVANGGTGVTTIGALTSAVLPSQTGQGGKYLTTDGSNVSWATVSGTVTSVSVATNDGVSGTVSLTNPAIPEITLALGNITPDNITISSGNGMVTNGTISVTNTNSATNKTSGAVIVSGGVGVSGDVWTTNLNATGDVTASASDARLKKDLVKIDDAVEKVRALTGYTYFWNQQICKEEGYEFSDSKQVGLIAQDVEKVLPEAVAPSPANPEYLTVRYEKLVALLVEAVKEQATEIENLKKIIGNK